MSSNEHGSALESDDDEGREQWIAAHRLPAVVASTAAREGWQPAQALIEKHWDRYVSTDPDRLLQAIRALPGDAFIERPTMLVAAAFLQHVIIGGEPSKFSHGEWLDAASGAGQIALMDTLGLLTGKTASLRTEGRLSEAVRAAEEARTAWETATAAERSTVGVSLPHFRIQWGRSFELADASGADLEYEEAYALAMSTKQPAVARRAAGQLAWLHAQRGQLNSAQSWLGHARALAPTSGRYEAVIYLTEALLRVDRGDIPGAGRELARTRGLDEGEYWSAALWVRSMHAHGPAAATIVESQLVEEAERRGKALLRRGAHGRYVRAAKARISALRRSPADAAVALALSSTDRVIAAAAAFADQQHEKAIALAEPAGVASEPPRIRCAALLVVAAAQRVAGNTGEAATIFAQANALIEHERLYSAYECVPSAEVEHLAAIAGAPLSTAPSPRTGGDLPEYGLTRREAEVLTLLVTDRPMARIAADLYISPNTLKATVRRVYRKIGANSRHDATRLVSLGGRL